MHAYLRFIYCQKEFGQGHGLKKHLLVCAKECIFAADLSEK
jgi:hypothetical protein